MRRDLGEGPAGQPSSKETKKNTAEEGWKEKTKAIIAIVLCTGATFLDATFFYTRVIDDEKKCISLDKGVGITAIILRFLSDSFYIFYYWSQWQLKKETMHFVADILAVVPLPQVVMILSMIKRTRRTGIWNALYVLIAQHALKAFQAATSLTEEGLTDTFGEWAFVFMFSYMYASHMLGALWYYSAIGRQIEFWESSFKKVNGCPVYCDDRKHQDNFCHELIKNTTYDFGIYSDARHDGVLNMTDYKVKMFYCFRWGLQNLSSFGQSLKTGTPWEENLYIISVTLTGILLFFFLIAKMQVYLQSETEKEEQTNRMLLGLKKLPENLRRQIRKQLQKDARQETKGDDIRNLLNRLGSGDLTKKIKCKLYLESLEKVKEFINCSDINVEDLCEYVKPVFYAERTHVVREGDPIDEMLIVVQGGLWTYSSKGITTSSLDLLTAKDFFGEELVAWAKDDKSSASNLPVSTKTVQALTDVEALVLMANDWKEIFKSYKQKLSSNQSGVPSDHTTGCSEITID